MVSYFLVAALAAVATLSSAAHRPGREKDTFKGQQPLYPSREKDTSKGQQPLYPPREKGTSQEPLYPSREKDTSKGQQPLYPPREKGTSQEPLDPSPSILNSCPNPNWADIEKYNTYPYESNVQMYWNCGNQIFLERCPENTVFNQELHYCDWERETSKNFKCPRFRPTSNGYKLFPDPNFKHQYHKCYFKKEYPSKRMACPYDHIFDECTSRCEYEPEL